MKKYIAFLLFTYIVSGVLPAKAQAYFPFSEENAIWSVNDMKYAVSGDTVIAGKEYKKMYKQYALTPFEFDLSHASYFMAFRNDMIEKKLYGVYYKEASLVSMDDAPGYLGNVISDSTEVLLYDFSASTGDTITIVSYSYFIDSDVMVCSKAKIIDDQNYTLLEDGSYRRTLITNLCRKESDTIRIMEGIGSTLGPFSSEKYPNPLDETLFDLLCFQENETLLYTINESCFSLGKPDKIDNYIPNKLNAKLYPNPTSGVLTLDFAQEYSVGNYRISILNMLGISIYDLNVTETQTQIHIDYFVPGVYILQIVKNKERVYQEKLIMQ